MADRLSWWVIPGALVVLARVVTLGDTGERAAAPPPAVVEAARGPGPVVLRDAAGRRSAPVEWASLTADALVLTAPAELAGVTATVTVWRRRGGAREAAPWLQCTTPVRSDATLRLAGLGADSFDVEVATGSGSTARTWSATAVAAPGRWALAAPVAAPPR